MCAPSLDGDRIVRTQENIAPEDFHLAVCDESHRYMHNDSDVGQMLEGKIAARRRLLLSDESQSSAISHSYPEMQRVKLTEVVRSTKRIVAGAASFQLHTDNGETVTSLGTEGPPLKTFLFEVEDQGKKFQTYAMKIVKAVVYIEHLFPAVSLHRRVAILTPNMGFLDQLRPILQKSLNEQLSHRSFRLESFEESLSCLPERILGRSPQQTKHESLIVDAMEQADGLEQMIVVCAGLDSAIRSSTEDLQTRSLLYRGITRAQLLAVVVNEHVLGGWLEFLGSVKYQDAELSDREADSPKVAEAAKKRHQAALAQATATAHPSPQDQTAAPQKQSRLEAAQGTSSSVKQSGVWNALHRLNPWGTSASPPKASRPKPKAAPVKTSSVWDTDSNSIPAPTELLFDPLPEVARKEVYATFDKEHGRRHDWKFDGDEAEVKGYDGFIRLLVSAETASTGILRWCIKSQEGGFCLIIGIIPAEKAEEDRALADSGGYGIKSRVTRNGAHP
ncbi:unnamed protein product, partial [Symbiodinium sp. CCMP2456]